MTNEPSLSVAARTLRPNEAEAAEAWAALVRAEKQQVDDLPNRPRPEDFYGPIADAFRADPRRTDEPLLESLRALVKQDETWIDVGAGGGRYTLPIALRARRVYAVEPSQGMRNVLKASARDNGIENIEVYDERWPSPESKAPVADVAFISQVGYDVAEFAGFSQQMEAHARRMCLSLMFEHAPISDFAPLWKPVHGENRVLLPALAEMSALLFARGRMPRVIESFDLAPRTFENVEALHRAVRRPLWVLEGTPEDARLAAAVRDMAVDVEGGVALSPRPRKLVFLAWEPR
ncbi:MAG TPA: methyltransferase domain-containing protein [Dehalococcoidia bacterium]|nr:methyltransferase domain-containing protein [Dehalococcoidia bacterium]